MNVDVTNTAPHQLMPIYEAEDLLIVGGGCGWQLTQQAQHFRSVRQIAARELTDHHRMSHDLAGLEELGEVRIGMAQVFDPDGCIYQNQRPRLLRRGGAST